MSLALFLRGYHAAAPFVNNIMNRNINEYTMDNVNDVWSCIYLLQGWIEELGSAETVSVNEHFDYNIGEARRGFELRRKVLQHRLANFYKLF